MKRVYVAIAFLTGVAWYLLGSVPPAIYPIELFLFRLACADFALILLLEAWGLGRWLWANRSKLKRTKAQAPDSASPAGEAKPKAEQAPWDELPVMAIPSVGRTARESVIAYAAKHGLRPYEAERGYLLGDRAGNFYRAAFA